MESSEPGQNPPRRVRLFPQAGDIFIGLGKRRIIVNCREGILSFAISKILRVMIDLVLRTGKALALKTSPIVAESDVLLAGGAKYGKAGGDLPHHGELSSQAHQGGK